MGDNVIGMVYDGGIEWCGVWCLENGLRCLILEYIVKVFSVVVCVSV